jgi:hypothetical protein
MKKGYEMRLNENPSIYLVQKIEKGSQIFYMFYNISSIKS